jgi:hypothetical protein
MSLSIGKAWDESRAILARDGTLVATVVAATVLVPQALGTLLVPANPATTAGAAAEPSSLSTMIGILTMIVALIGSLAVTSIALRPGQTVGESIRHASRSILPMIGVALLIGIPLFATLMIILAFAVGGNTPDEMLANLKNMTPGAAFAILLWCAAALYLSLRMAITAPLAVAETHNVVAIVKRSWRLTRGHVLRLLGYAFLIGIVILVLQMFAELLGGLFAKLLFGDPEPMTISALIIGLFLGVASAVAISLSALMSARIYAQLSSPVTVPSVDH